MVSEHEHDPFIEEIAGELRRPVRFDSTFESRVMASLEPSVVPLPVERKASTPWILRPRPFYVSPLAGLAVAAGLVAIITMSVMRTVPDTQLAATDSSQFVLPATSQVVPVAETPVASASVAEPFTYIDSNAKSVAVVGSFNGWDSTKNVLTRSADGVWSTNIMLAPGRYEYQLMVDGKLIADPTAQQTAESEFGAANSVLIVTPR
jgi:hypothetical protein